MASLLPVISQDEPDQHALPKPPNRRLSVDDIFDSYTDKPDTALLKDHFFAEGRLTEEAALKILRAAAESMRKEPNVLVLAAPITVVGDVHGQFYDLVKATSGSVGGEPSETQYLFLGDYVDRGCFSIEILLYLYALKMARANSVHMLRGNHECRHLTTYFTFKKEVLTKYSEAVYEAALDSFNCLPLCALINRRFFCVHGGLSPSITTIADINKINRFTEPANYGPMCDLLWSDPEKDFGSNTNKEHFCHNATRGCSYNYTYEAVVSFLRENKLTSMIRAHEAQQQGYTMHRHTPQDLGAFPALITIFSAPNYLDVYGNKGAVLKYDGAALNIRQFNSSPHPYWLPNFMDVFNWSVPFIADKVSDVLVKILSICSDDELNEDADDHFEGGMTVERKRAIRGKIQAVGRMQRTFSTLREESESVVALKGLCGRGSLPPGALADGPGGLRDAVQLLGEKGTRHKQLRDVSFEEAKLLDSPNERFPPTKNPMEKLVRPPIKKNLNKILSEQN